MFLMLAVARSIVATVEVVRYGVTICTTANGLGCSIKQALGANRIRAALIEGFRTFVR